MDEDSEEFDQLLDLENQEEDLINEMVQEDNEYKEKNAMTVKKTFQAELKKTAGINSILLGQGISMCSDLKRLLERLRELTSPGSWSMSVGDAEFEDWRSQNEDEIDRVIGEINGIIPYFNQLKNLSE